jgi:2-keto-4-pentenoate hydratase/2-oxohepta-3-ene-1,7-dioic acid hydratase in catechol pathway
MRLVSYRKGGLEGVGVEVDGGVIPTRYLDMVRLIEDGEAGLAHAREMAALGAGSAIEPDRILAPVRRPQKMFGSGPNFLKHLEEEPGATLTDEQFFFSKLPSAIIGEGDAIELTRPGTELQADYEVELGIVIGRTARFVSEDEAMDHVFGYTVVHDFSSRWIQFKDQQITLGKNLDTFCPMGPALVTRDAIGDVHDLRMRAYLNGELMQDESTSAMRFSVPRMVSYLSEILTLHPGDIITGGTPDGCGCFRDPPVYVQPGDTVAVEIEGIGRLTNPVVLAERQLSRSYFFRQTYD